MKTTHSHFRITVIQPEESNKEIKADNFVFDSDKDRLLVKGVDEDDDDVFNVKNLQSLKIEPVNRLEV